MDNGGYYYGKLNTVLVLRTSIGYMKEFIPKQSIKGVSVSYVFNLGSLFRVQVTDFRTGVLLVHLFFHCLLHEVKGEGSPFVKGLPQT